MGFSTKDEERFTLRTVTDTVFYFVFLLSVIGTKRSESMDVSIVYVVIAV